MNSKSGGLTRSWVVVMPIAFVGAIVCAVLLNETFKRDATHEN